MKKIVFVCEFHQETNAFSPAKTDVESFKLGGYYEGEDIPKNLRKTPCAVNGIITAAEEAGAEIIYGCTMFSQSGGPVKQETFELFCDKTVEKIKECEHLDGIFVSLHGATQAEETEDACGEILRRIREAAGEEVIISASCDMHANVTETMVKSADYICGYLTYPHADFYETGYRAAKIGMMRINGDAKPVMVRTVVPMIAPASGYSTLDGEYGKLISRAKEYAASGKVVDCSVFQMQPWMDVSDAGSAVVAIAEDESAAAEVAQELAQTLYSLRDSFNPALYSIDEVIRKAEANNSGKPVVLVDSADSTNAGAAGDSPAVIERLLALSSDATAACVLDDAPAAELAHKLGVGAVAEFTIGGTKDKIHSKPVTVEARVKSLHDGRFMQEGPAGKGLVRNIGKCAVLGIGNIDVMVCHNVSGNGDPQLFRHFGIEPLFYQLVVVKACTSFKAAYRSIASEICDTDTPGAAPAVLQRLDYKHMPKDFYPFSDINDYVIPTPKRYR